MTKTVIRREPVISEERKNRERNERVLEIIKGIAESEEDLQNNYTPPEICDTLLEKIDLKGNKSILILYNIELIFSLYKSKYQGQITFFTSSEKKMEFAKKLFGDIKVEYIEESEDPLEKLEEMKKWPEKFDIIVSNPPYGSGTKKLDLKFLDKSVDLASEKIIFVHPASQYVDGKGRNDLYNYTINKIKPFVNEIDFFNGNGVFNIGIFVPCSITYLNKLTESNREFNFKNRINGQEIKIEKDKINDLSNFGYSEIFSEYKLKIERIIKDSKTLKDISNVLGFSGDQSSRMILKNKNSFFVQFTHIRGGISNSVNKLQSDDFYTLFKKNKRVDHGSNPINRIWFEFETEIEALNFLNFCKTNFVRSCIGLVKTNANIAKNELSYIPLVDFTQEWTDERLYAHFNITEEEQAFIKEIIPPYYD